MSTGLLTRTKEAFWGLLDPWMFVGLSASFIPQTTRHIFATHAFLPGLAVLLSPARFREVWFGQFWGYAGPQVREGAGPRVLPLLDGRTSRGAVTDSPTGPGVGGVVIEVGAGSGLWVEVFSDRYLAAARDDDAAPGEEKKRGSSSTARTKITRVYGVEPNLSQHPALRRAIADAGLEDVYEIVPVGIEDLSSSGEGKTKKKKKWDGNIEPGSVDCIVSVLCLCSIPDPERHVRELYSLLRPGGRWYAYEHVRVEHSWYMGLYQRFLNIVWPRFIGGCEMCRQTEKTLREAGPWANINIGQPSGEPWYHCLPHILGVLTK
ncbi:S-adenosyl-L-methionine-dependent methyltransferase [Xylaria castorea]|nr:S-adenosyl-L-methionine-dependent methyltransferase [Xylaria castorea]